MTIHTRFRIDGMDCAGCAAKIDTAVRRLPGVADVTVSVANASMTVRHADDAALGAAIAKKVASLGYGARALSGGAGKPSDDRHAHDHASCGHDHHDHAGHHHDGHDHNHDHAHEKGHKKKSASATPIELHGHDHAIDDGPWWRSRKGQLTIASGVALVAGFTFGQLAPAYSTWAFIAAMLVGLVPIARRAVMAALNGMPFTIETLMTIAAVGAVAIDAAEEAAAVVFLFLVGEMLEGVAAARARAGIRSLAALAPATAQLESNGATSEVPADSLRVGAIIRVRAGDRVAADGDIIEGDSAIDEALVTGESAPVRKTVGAQVFAGTINGDGALRVRVTAASSDNMIARIVKLVEEAQEQKAPTERFIDRFSRYYTPGVLALGALVAIAPPLLAGGDWASWIYKGLAVLLIGCPCALVISTPAAIASALSGGARRGLLMKGGAALETVGKVTAVAFDKTGTLTNGKPVVTDVVPFARSAQDVLSTAAALEAGSSHPLALAILARAKMDAVNAPVADALANLGGRGVAGQIDGVAAFLGSPPAASERAPLSAEQQARIGALQEDGKTVSVLTIGGEAAGAIALLDEPRPDAKEGLAALRAAGVRTIMLTGDNRRVAEAIGRQLDVEPRAELLPEQKQDIVRALQREGLRVAKVGDGVNDAPALAAADVGIAMGGGADVALETADAAALQGRVGDVAAMIALSKQTMRVIGENITIAIGLKAVFLVTTVLGVTGLWPAILADTGATVLVTMNSLRLLRGPR